MKIAVASEGRMVAQHFGHCESFNIYTVQEGKVTGSKFVQNPGHKPGFLPNYLNELGVKVIISGDSVCHEHQHSDSCSGH